MSKNDGSLLSEIMKMLGDALFEVSKEAGKVALEESMDAFRSYLRNKLGNNNERKREDPKSERRDRRRK